MRPEVIVDVLTVVDVAAEVAAGLCCTVDGAVLWWSVTGAGDIAEHSAYVDSKLYVCVGVSRPLVYSQFREHRHTFLVAVATSVRRALHNPG